MWKIEHKCVPSQDDPGDYGMTANLNHRKDPVTTLVCPNCRERLVFEGHDVFDQAKQAQARHPVLGAKGFVIARGIED